MEMNKVCSICKILKSLNEYFKDKTHKDGLTSQCKICKQKGNEKSRLKFRDRDLKNKSEYYFQNKSIMRSQNEEWKKNNPEKMRQYKRKYKYNNRILNNEWDKKRYQKEQKATPFWTNKELIEVIYINCPIGYDVDHIIPLNHKLMSGLNIPENLRYLPKQENTKKGNKLDSELKFELHPLDWKEVIFSKKVS